MKRFEKKDFTDDMVALEEFIGTLTAFGDGGAAEDVIGALGIIRDDFKFSK